MDNEEKTTTSSNEHDLGIDALDAVIAAALADRVLPPLPDDMDLEAAARILTPEDRAALASMGTPRELVRRILASIESEEQPVSEPPIYDPADNDVTVDELVAEASTFPVEDDMTIPAPGSRFSEYASLALRDLMKRLNEVQATEQILWPSCYRKVQELGRGGQGTVYLTECLDELSGEQALKVYSPQPYGSADAYHEDMQRLLNVATFVHRIHHDNLVDVQRFVDYRGIYVMVMQWIDGFDLRHLLDVKLLEQLRQSVTPDRWDHLSRVIYATPAPGRLCLQPLQAVNIIEKCLSGLSALHGHGIVHGDIKPSNIMLDSNGSIRLIDIGSACRYLTPPRQRIWTPRYAPPEFLERGEWTPQSDLASLGYVLVELLSGDPNLGGPSVGNESTRTVDRHRDDVLLEAKRCLPERLTELLPANISRSEKLLSLCRKLIDPDPTKRFADASKAIDGDLAGAWHFRMEVTKGGLAVREAGEIKQWVYDVKHL
jgi:serine/threonine-protein kinase